VGTRYRDARVRHLSEALSGHPDIFVESFSLRMRYLHAPRTVAEVAMLFVKLIPIGPFNSTK
jgi:hypothetical protein